MMTQKKQKDKSIKDQLLDIGIDLMDEVSFDDTYCPQCEEPIATRSAVKPWEVKCRFCNITFTEN